MYLYLRNKCQVSSIILTSFRQGVILILLNPPPQPQNETLKSPRRLGLNIKVTQIRVSRAENRYNCSQYDLFVKISQVLRGHIII